MIDKIEALEGVIGVIIGHSYGGKSLGKQSRTGAVKVQRIDGARQCVDGEPKVCPKRSAG